MKSFTTLVLSLLAAASSVSAHGYVSSFTANGKTYQGNVPNNPKFDSPIRLINDISPVKGANNPNILCGPNAQKAKVVAPVTAGSTVKFGWRASPNQEWPHNTGPIMNYMAKCDGNCANFDASKARWFKVSQDGRNGNGAWVQADLMAGKEVSMTIPKELAPGQYLIRHEIIALHLATTKGGAEFYDSCIQVDVKGSGTGVPTETVSFPGAYKDSDPGIFDPNVFNAKSTYKFPGPKVVEFKNGPAGAVSNPTETSEATQPTDTPTDDGNTAEPTPTSTGKGGNNGAVPTATPASTSSEPANPTSTKSCKASGGDKKRMVKRHIMHSSH